jgi:hypothetical protein
MICVGLHWLGRRVSEVNCHFFVGQKVVCVDADGADYLFEGRVYTVTRVIHSAAFSRLDGTIANYAVLVDEAQPNLGTIAFDARRFRPVVERKTDISIFTDMLIKQKQPVDA